jgi:hypothetical protein
MAHIGKTANSRPCIILLFVVDFTVEEGERMLRTMYGEKADAILKDDWKVVKYVLYSRDRSAED